MNQQELAQTLNGIATDLGAASDELTKASDEINKRIDDLVAAQAGDTSPEVDAATQALKDAASKLTGIAKKVDDIVPDEVVPGSGDTGGGTTEPPTT